MGRKRGPPNTVDPCRNCEQQSIAFHAAAEAEKKLLPLGRCDESAGAHRHPIVTSRRRPDCNLGCRNLGLAAAANGSLDMVNGRLGARREGLTATKMFL